MEDKKTKNIEFFDYKDINSLGKHINPHGRMYNRRRTRLQAKQQRGFAQAIKRSRYMALMPYVSP